MKCARCSAEIPAQSQFCLRCGTPVHAAPTPTGAAMPGAPAAPRQLNRPMIGMVVALALAILAFAGFMVRGALTQHAANASTGQLVQAPGEGASGSLVQAPGDSHSGAPVQAPADNGPNRVVQTPAAGTNTTDIDDYLRFVKGIEDQKMAITKQELAEALTSSAGQLAKQAEAASDDVKSKEYLPGVAHESSGLEHEWDDLSKTFGARVPPPSCVSLRDAYYAYLGKVQSMFYKFHSALAGAQTDPSKAISALTGMQGTASAEADTAARTADDALYDICRKYNLRKDFDIKTDPSSSTGILPGR